MFAKWLLMLNLDSIWDFFIIQYFPYLQIFNLLLSSNKKSYLYYQNFALITLIIIPMHMVLMFNFAMLQ